MRNDREYLQDILEAIDRVGKYAARGREAFDSDELIQNWIVTHLTVIGEAVRGLSDELKQRYVEVPWKQIIGMRNILVHRYFDIDKDAVWSAVTRDLPALRGSVLSILSQMDL